ncbi:hypothetical protein GC167_05710 [bacterium]|nr:hypothetical protein [bacterium]
MKLPEFFMLGMGFVTLNNMKYSKLLNGLLLGLSFGCSSLSFPGAQKQGTSEAGLWGYWRLDGAERKEGENAPWREWEAGWQGYVLYGESGGMALHLSPVGYEEFEGDVRNFTPDQPDSVLAHLALAYAYMGSYAVDVERSLVTHTKKASNNPTEWNQTSVRRYRRSGDTLWLEPLEERNAGMRLRFLKER